MSINSDTTNRFVEEVLKRMVEKENIFFKTDEPNLPKKIEVLFKTVLRENHISLGHNEYEEILSQIIDYFLGLGPLEKLLKDPDISEIMVNGPKEVFIEKNGTLQPTDITFKDEQQLMYFVDKIVSHLGRRVTELEPYVDTRLKDGSRVNIVKAPISALGPVVTIRKFSHCILNLQDLINLKTLNETVAEFLKACVISRLNILISGGTSSGKTTLLNVLASLIPENERIITIEDTRELQLYRKHTIPLETRPPNIEGKGEITIRQLVKNALHMRPDRIIIGEVRSEEVFDMIQAMNVGHEGSMTTLHANSSLEAMDRLEILALLGNLNMSSEVARRQIISAIDLVIHMVRLSDGSRQIIQISEVVETKKEYLLEDVFILSEDTAQGGLKFTGKIPAFYNRLKNKANFLCQYFEESK